MSEVTPILMLHDLDLIVAEIEAPDSVQRMRKLGLGITAPETLEKARAKLLDQIDRRWLNLYERAQARYGRSVAAVRDRVCQGCFITLPTSASPTANRSLTLCESCGRILYWG